MKNHKKIKVGLIFSENFKIKDYQINIYNTLKKNNIYDFKFFKVNNNNFNKVLKNLFFFEKKFQKSKLQATNIFLGQIKNSTRINLEDISKYITNDVDIFINLSGEYILDKLKHTKKPLWDFIFGEFTNQFNLISFHEIINFRPYSKVSICQMQEKTKTIIGEGYFNTKNYALFHQEFILEKSAVLLLKTLSLYNLKKVEFKKYKKNLFKYKKIETFNLIKYFFNAYFLKVFRKNVYFEWNIYFNKNKNFLNFEKFGIKIRNLFNKRYFADPFVYTQNNKEIIFFENFDNTKKKGHISLLDLKNKDKIYDILNKDYHLSYPFILKLKNKIYLIPETSKMNELQIWKCFNFPYKWKLFKKRLKGKNFADPTFFLDKNNILWLFLNLSIDKFKDHNSELYIFKVNGLFDEFVPHKLNPVIIDNRLARNAGNLFYKNNKLIKPCQINTYGHYGNGLQFIEISKLSLNEFKYKKLKKYKNIHHFSTYKKMVTWDKQKKAVY